ncbi:MAG TPA: hypothetical protein VNL16_02440 [Chloroflexota bacterium]|nr:hypothetical protein [Chloroflexota bacterium]
MRLIILALAVPVLLLVAIPIWLAFISLVGVVMPWAVFALLIWAIVAVSRGPRQREWSRHSWRSQPVPTPRAPYRSQPQVQPQPWSPPPPRPRPELPIDIQVKVEQIRRKVEVLLGYASRFPPFSKDLYLVRQTASDYLPRTIDAYLALPPVDPGRVVVAPGKTALQELREQLDLLDSKLNEIAEDLQRQDLDRLLANRRFLEERFGRVSI